MEAPRTPVDLWTAEKLVIDTEDLSQQLLEKYQLNEIKKMLHVVKNKSSFYKELFCDYDPDSIETMEDFRKLPTTCEKDLIDQEWRFQCVNASEVQRIVTVSTTGTTGCRKRISFTQNDLKKAMEFAPYGFAMMCNPGDKVLVMMSGGSAGSIGDNVRRSLEPFGMKVEVFGQLTDLEKAMQCMVSFRPDVIIGIPFQMAALERYMNKKKKQFSVKSVLMSADDVPEAICVRLKNSWKCNTFRHYGMTELGMFGAVECLGQDGYHLRACDHLFEILEPDEEGFGEIALTTFHHESMPLVRYRTGDIGRMKMEKCVCKSPLMRIETIRGRRCNSVLFPNGRMFIRDIAEIVYADSSIADFECAVGNGRLHLFIRTLEGDFADTQGLRYRLKENAGLEGIDISIESNILHGFEEAQNTKKRMELLV
ncbi:DVU_1553 family AMP-dependent CoA ligase [Parasporobacterium paucivorans]|uniref:Phenylacetate-coenzyme A ligase PaaK, adenylate-forming domain family n=1 Tax=Parasporobacterium paucivorans DSM 15970 TaxID=1122934 RepID=A0A1M6HV21_9FIRM|nr:phenylacetate--CoA ligase family protein [Parasporobacterium paucivorans]SHJ25974.1 Phenylacetate-coenzyme A ligase PaaK, adenylate-forming domain family [Parasporobacterium paucivorans DSM 15970]